MKSKIVLIIIAFISTITIAQTKVGTIDSEYIVGLMPEVKIVLEKSQAYGAKLDSSLTKKVNDFQVKLKSFQDNQATMSDLMKKANGQELSELDADIKKYQENGTKLMQLRSNELMRPIYSKLNKVIEEISKTNGYTQILTVTGNQFAYIDSKFDITKQVLDKLGIKEVEAEK